MKPAVTKREARAWVRGYEDGLAIPPPTSSPYREPKARAAWGRGRAAALLPPGADEAGLWVLWAMQQTLSR